MKNGKSDVNQSEIWFPIDLCFKLAYASKILTHDLTFTTKLKFQRILTLSVLNNLNGNLF